MRVLCAAYPFGKFDASPRTLLNAEGWALQENPYGRRLRSGEVGDLLAGMAGVIAGTEPYDRQTIQRHAGTLKVIARVGIGLDNVDLAAAREAGVAVTYTPDAPSRAVAELTVAQMLNLARHVHASHRSVREGAWNRLMGWLLSELKIGVLGLGRIGKLVCQLLQPFGCELLACDTAPDLEFAKEHGVTLVDAETLFSQCDMVTVHIPLNAKNRHFVNRARLARMKTGSFLINTARGPVVDEAALTDALLQKHLGGAALDVFEKEPYEGLMTEMDNVGLTAHMGASARRSRKDMEYQAAEDCIRVLKNLAPLRPVTGEAYAD